MNAVVAEARSKHQTVPVSPRVRRARWKEPRLLLGLLLVAAAVTGTVVLVNSMDERTAVYVAKQDITLGEPLGEENLEVAHVQLGDSMQHYVPAEAQHLQDARANTFIGSGQLIAQDFVTRSELGSRRPINIDLPVDLSPAITPGSRVDVWIAQREPGTASYGTPELLANLVEVSARTERAAGLVGQSAVNLELLVEPAYLEPLLQALANESRIIVVYNPAGESS
ncbi:MULTISPECIES: hypothetical protein [Glutamicibacter]|uniref:hypothetical protein n=1 Tax=Glutamicibacter TaxID=1742989 RepID=UPI0010FDFC98|nr:MULTISPECIES: hypothetical protein [Glutamicibacter]TLK51223.1 hypothetical protein FDN03_12560 [Glutamicibacter sp. V16R2B1]